VLLLSGGGDLERGAYRGQFIGEDVDAAVVLATDDPNDLSGPEVAGAELVQQGE